MRGLAVNPDEPRRSAHVLHEFIGRFHGAPHQAAAMAVTSGRRRASNTRGPRKTTLPRIAMRTFIGELGGRREGGHPQMVGRHGADPLLQSTLDVRNVIRPGTIDTVSIRY